MGHNVDICIAGTMYKNLKIQSHRESKPLINTNDSIKEMKQTINNVRFLPQAPRQGMNPYTKRRREKQTY